MIAETNLIASVNKILTNIPDPEIPVVNIVELGIVREVIAENNRIVVKITPTYSACPATKFIENEISTQLAQNGINGVIETVLFPPWTTDWISDEAREKLRAYGITPPEKNADEHFIGKPKKCPRCTSMHTKQISRFGSTLCKASYQCLDCLEPFDYFKCH